MADGCTELIYPTRTCSPSYAPLYYSVPSTNHVKRHLRFPRWTTTQGASPGVESRSGHTALTWAAVCGLDDVAAELITQRGSLDSAIGAIVASTRSEGKTALHNAAFNGNSGIVMLLLDRLRDLLLTRRYTRIPVWKCKNSNMWRPTSTRRACESAPSISLPVPCITFTLSGHRGRGKYY